MSNRFRELSDELFSSVSVEDLAAEIGCSVQSVKQARLSEGSAGFRKAPVDYQRAARKLAKAQAKRLLRLASRLADNG
jgi:hypothetical protein